MCFFLCSYFTTGPLKEVGVVPLHVPTQPASTLDNDRCPVGVVPLERRIHVRGTSAVLSPLHQDGNQLGSTPVSKEIIPVLPRTHTTSSVSIVSDPVFNSASFLSSSSVVNTGSSTRSESTARSCEVKTSAVAEESFSFDSAIALVQRELGCVGRSGRTVGLLPMPQSVTKCSKDKTRQFLPSLSTSSSSTSWTVPTTQQSNSGAMDLTSPGVSDDKLSLNVEKFYTHVHERGRRLPLSILGKCYPSLSASEQVSRPQTMHEFSSAVGSIDAADECPVVGGTNSGKGSLKKCAPSQLIVPNLNFCIGEVLCFARQNQQLQQYQYQKQQYHYQQQQHQLEHQQQHQQHQQQQILCVCKGIEKCGLCLSGLEGVCGKIRLSEDCCCDGCLAGIKHLFKRDVIYML